MTGRAYQEITDRIIALLESGSIPWRKPWTSRSALPRNLVSKREYRGVNFFILLAMEYESPYWLTFRQVASFGATVKRGEKACPLVFWKQIATEDRKTGKTVDVPMLRYYHVFNTAQCEGLSEQVIEDAKSSSGCGQTAAEIVEGMPERPEIRHGFRSAFYSLHDDAVHMPDRERFNRIEAYYATLFHELVHATGHERRLNRKTLNEQAGFGSDPYCKEELVAEMGAAFLSASAGTADSTIENSAAYLSAWISRLSTDNSLVVQAASLAQRATDFILRRDQQGQAAGRGEDNNPKPPGLESAEASPSGEPETVPACSYQTHSPAG